MPLLVLVVPNPSNAFLKWNSTGWVPFGGIGDGIVGSHFTSMRQRIFMTLERHISKVFPHWNKRWGHEGLEACWLRRCRCIYKSRSSFKHRVLEWLMLPQGLAIKTKLQNVGVISIACMFVIEMKWLSISFADAHLRKLFGHVFGVNLTIILLLNILGKVLSLGTLGWLQLQIFMTQFSSFLWKYQ